ncbi:MAG: fibronectin type III domain-containing protein [Clostridium sp.]|nr:fibronectin type III domain-containing protein [Clostridium sp.]
MTFTQKSLLAGAVGALLASSSLIHAAATDVPTAYGYQMGDDSGKFGFVSFPVNDVASKQIVKSVSSGADQLGAADYVDGKLYGFTLELDPFGAIYTSEYVVINPANGYATEKAISKYADNRVVDMAYDYASNRMYALAELANSTGSIGKTALYVVNLDNGELHLVGLPGEILALNGNGNRVEESLIALAASPAGELYAMGEYRQLYKLDKLTGKATAVGTRNRVAIQNRFQSMAFTADGHLYHSHNHPDHQYFMMVDPQSGVLFNPVTGEEVVVNSDFTNTAHRISGDPQITALYFTDRQVDALAPAEIKSFTATLRSGTANTVDLAWQLPSSATLVYVYRFGASEPIAKLSAGVTSYADTDAPSGQVVYSVVAVNGTHIGYPVYVDVQAGADQLKAVSNLKAVLNGSEATITWDAPTATVNGGYADYDAITYIVTQVSGSKRTVLSQGCAETSYVAALLGAGTYSFEVTPVSCGIEGVPAASNEVTISQGFSIPYFTGFEDDQDGTLWSFANKNSQFASGWSITTSSLASGRYDGKFAQFKTAGSDSYPADDWMFSPAITFEAGEHELSYYANGASYDTHTYEIVLGANPEDVSTFTQIIEKIENEKIFSKAEDAKNNFALHTVKFSVAAPGTYHIGLHGIGATTYATLKIDNLSVKKAEGQDGIADIVSGEEPAVVTVVSLDGRVILRNADPEALQTLAPGIYIINNRKVAITK